MDLLLALPGLASLALAGCVLPALGLAPPRFLGSRLVGLLVLGPPLAALAMLLARAAGLDARVPSALLLVAALAAAARARARGQHPRAPHHRLEVLRWGLLLLPTVPAWLWASTTIPVLWDPTVLWVSKAAAFRAAGSLDLSPLGEGAFMALRGIHHPVGFPLLMDLTVAWLPGFEPRVCRLPSAWFLTLLAVLAERALAGVAGPWLRLPVVWSLLLLPSVQAQGHDGHADLALGATLLAVWLCLHRAEPPWLAGVLAGGAAHLKVEGLAAGALGALLLGAARRPAALGTFVASALPLVVAAWLLRPAGLDGAAGPGLQSPWVLLQHPAELVSRLTGVAGQFVQSAGQVPPPGLAAGVLLGCGAFLPGPASARARLLLAAGALWLCAVAGSYLLHPQWEWQAAAHHRRAWLQALPAFHVAGSLGLLGFLQAWRRPPPSP